MENNNVSPQQPVNTQPPAKGLAIAAMVLGIVSLVLFCMWYVAIPCGILAVIFGAVAKSKGNKSAMATTGIVLGIIAIAIAILLATIFVSLLSSIAPFAGQY